MSRLRDEHGFSLIEVLTASALMIVVISATLFSFEHFTTNANSAQRQNDAQDTARNATDRLARDLRNLASPTPYQPQAIEMASGYDLVFQSVNPVGPPATQNPTNVRRIRYCLDNRTSSNEVLWTQQQTWTTTTPPSMPSTASCPDSAWPTREEVADHITNENGGKDRPVWTFNSSTLTAITSVQTQLYVDYDTAHSPPESMLASGVFLRNQNQAPVASFTATPAGAGKVVLNGSVSYDPEGQDLTYQWCVDGTCNSSWKGIVYTAATTAGQHSFSLKVFDPAGLEGDAAAQTVNVT